MCFVYIYCVSFGITQRTYSSGYPRVYITYIYNIYTNIHRSSEGKPKMYVKPQKKFYLFFSRIISIEKEKQISFIANKRNILLCHHNKMSLLAVSLVLIYIYHVTYIIVIKWKVFLFFVVKLSLASIFLSFSSLLYLNTSSTLRYARLCNKKKSFLPTKKIENNF